MTHLPNDSVARLLIYRLTHIENVGWIFANGLHSQNSTTRDPNFVQIGSSELIGKRARRQVTLPPGGTLADYVPFYFTPSSIMLFNIQTGYNGVPRIAGKDLVLLVASLKDIEAAGHQCLICPTHAYMLTTRFYSVADGAKEIDWQLLERKDFSLDPADPSKKERYQAEAIVYRHVPVGSLLGVATFDEVARDRVRLALPSGTSMVVEARPGWFFS